MNRALIFLTLVLVGYGTPNYSTPFEPSQWDDQMIVSRLEPAKNRDRIIESVITFHQSMANMTHLGEISLFSLVKNNGVASYHRYVAPTNWVGLGLVPTNLMTGLFYPLTLLDDGLIIYYPKPYLVFYPVVQGPRGGSSGVKVPEGGLTIWYLSALVGLCLVKKLKS